MPERPLGERLTALETELPHFCPATSTWTSDNSVTTLTAITPATVLYLSLTTAGTGGPCTVYVYGEVLQ
jgi:hypothetical protein